jgi:hypothetical protein
MGFARHQTMVALVLGWALSASAASAIANQNPIPPADGQEQRPAAGVLCVWAIVSVAAEVGRRCRPGGDPAFQAELERAVSRFDDYVLRNSDATPEGVARFKMEQGGADDPELCRSDGVGFYDHLASVGRQELREQIEVLLSRPGRPEWGACL